MESGGGGKSRLLGRLLSKLRPASAAPAPHHHRQDKYRSLAVNYSIASTVMSGNTDCSSTSRSTRDDDSEPDTETPERDTETLERDTNSVPEEERASDAANNDLRYGGQYFTPEQLPEFCDQLHHLVQVIRNIQSYAAVTGEYPAELERRLSREAAEVCALSCEARNARDAVSRARHQAAALRALKGHLTAHLNSLRETEVRELESTVRVSDRKLYKSWESLKDSSDPAAFEPLLDEIRSKQGALECLVRLVESRRATLSRRQPLAHPLPPPPPPPSTLLPSTLHHDEVVGRRRRADEAHWRGAGGGGAGVAGGKRRRREARSVPLSGQPSAHRAETTPLTGIECRSRYRAGNFGNAGNAGNAGAGALELPAGRGRSGRDIVFFTSS